MRRTQQINSQGQRRMSISEELELKGTELLINVKDLVRKNYRLIGNEEYEFDEEKYEVLILKIKKIKVKVKLILDSQFKQKKTYEIFPLGGSIVQATQNSNILHVIVCGCQQLNDGEPLPLDIQLLVCYDSIKYLATTKYIYQYIYQTLHQTQKLKAILAYMNEHPCISLQLFYFLMKQARYRSLIMEHFKNNIQSNLVNEPTQFDIIPPVFKTIPTHFYWVHGVRLLNYDYLQLQMNKGSFWMHVIHKLATSIQNPLIELVLLYKDQSRQVNGGMVINIYGYRVYEDPIMLALQQGLAKSYSTANYYAQLDSTEFEEQFENNFELNYARTIILTVKKKNKIDPYLLHIINENLKQGCEFTKESNARNQYIKKRAFIILSDVRQPLPSTAKYIEFPSKKFIKYNRKYKIDFLGWYASFNMRSCVKPTKYDCLGILLWSILLSLKDLFIEKVASFNMCYDILKNKLYNFDEPQFYGVKLKNSEEEQV